MGIKEGSTAVLVDVPQDVIALLSFDGVTFKKKLGGSFDYIHLFTTTQEDFLQKFPLLKTHLKANGMLWVSWPKAKQLHTNLSLRKIIELGYNYGLVESTALSIDAVWSALKFTHPKHGKDYQNSYGQLKSVTTKR